MKKVLLYGKDADTLIPTLKNKNIEVVAKDPDFVISYGGDGTFLQAEYNHPYIPKILIKNSRICKLCPELSAEEIITKLSCGEYKQINLPKIEARVGGNILVAVNDIVVHNSDARHGLRYNLFLDDTQVGETIIGDGVVVSTPLGSSGYYRSITDSIFEVGIGLAFNNSTEQADHIVLREDRTIRVHITRGPAVVYADNQEKEYIVEEGEDIIIASHPQKTVKIDMV